jgi:pimeloyl-ACP methyl ester carboxylesterase
VQIAYQVEGTGPPVLLVHGFSSTYEHNWRGTGWADALQARGRQVIGIDCRGHGASGAPHELERYTGGRMHQDAVRLLDHLKLERVDAIGYSMGSWLLLPVMVHHGERLNSVVLGGAGAPLRRPPPCTG